MIADLCDKLGCYLKEEDRIEEKKMTDEDIEERLNVGL